MGDIPTDGQTDNGRQSFPTIIICESSLFLVGLTHLLANTQFPVISTEHSEDLPPCGSAPALFIVDANYLSNHVIGTINRLKDRSPRARVVALANHFDLNFVRQGRHAGADGFCLTGSDREVLIKSLELVMLGETVLPTSLITSVINELSSSPERKPLNSLPAEALPPKSSPHRLSAREEEVLGYLKDGAPNKVIARRLDVAEATVKIHVKAILRKVGATNRTQAAMWASTHLQTSSGSSLTV
jgi:two-component system nitrate/nitrite response regulator NarL